MPVLRCINVIRQAMNRQECLSYVVILAIAIAPAGLLSAEDNERAIAEWIIHQGGRVILTGADAPISDLSTLPEQLRIQAIDLTGTLIEARDLGRLSGLTQIKELFLPA